MPTHNWVEEPVQTMTLPSGRTLDWRPVDLAGLVMSSDNASVPDGLLTVLAAQLSGQSIDRELVCIKGHELPLRGYPCIQGDIRGKVVDVIGTVEKFTVRVSMISAGRFQPGEVSFGGMNLALVESEREYSWRISSDPEAARKELPQMGSFINLVVKAASARPVLVDTVTDPETEWPIAKVSQTDKLFIFQRVMPREVRPAGTFPEEPTAGLAAAPDVQGIQLESSNGVRA